MTMIEMFYSDGNVTLAFSYFQLINKKRQCCTLYTCKCKIVLMFLSQKYQGQKSK